MIARDNIHQSYGEHPCQVMVVDEQDVFRRKIREILHGIGGFQIVAETTSCRMALETVARIQIDLVIAELTLGDGDGVELTTSLKQLPTPPQVIIFSAAMHDPALMQIILAGADGYLMKDTPTRDIIRAFKNFERGGPAMQPSVTANVIRLLVEQCKIGDVHPTNDLAQDILAADPTLVAPVSSNGIVATPVSSNGYAFPSHLSPQEEKVFALLRLGQRNKQIATQLAISPYTVSKHVQNILRKLGVVNRTQAAAYTSFEGVPDHFFAK
ncbi:MAG: response regulator transcription factor [Ktedonobacteraceae bacterium]